MCTIERIDECFDRCALYMHRERTETEAEVLKVLVDKQDIGFHKYNQGIDYSDDYDWLREAEEEMADGLQYIVAARMRREDNIKHLMKAVEILTETFQWVEAEEVDEMLMEALAEINEMKL
jgi:hypothetical protein